MAETFCGYAHCDSIWKRILTAEIAILNKQAVALAADSAVTISMGAEQQKIFDSAEKLFELSDCNPIGVMVYSGAQITQIPLSILINMNASTTD